MSKFRVMVGADPSRPSSADRVGVGLADPPRAPSEAHHDVQLLIGHGQDPFNSAAVSWILLAALALRETHSLSGG